MDTLALHKVFLAYVRELIDVGAIDARDWKIQEIPNRVELTIPKSNPDGFDVTVWAEQDEVSVYSEYIVHQHFTSDGNHRLVSENAMGLVRDLLSPGMRLRVTRISGRPVRGQFESLRDGKWVRESATALFVFPWFRKREESLYVNRRLAARKNA